MATGFGLAIIADARAIATSITTRIANIRSAPDTLRILTVKLDRVTGQLARVDELLQTGAGAIPDEVTVDIEATLGYVRDTLIRSHATVEKVCSKAFPGAASSSRAKVESMIRRTFRANPISSTMNDLQAPLQEASFLLSTLISLLATALRSSDVPAPNLDCLQITDNVEVYHEAASTPVLPLGTYLNFNALDEDGNPCTTEAKLKACILAANSASTVTAPAEVMTYPHSVLGMAGVGKTLSLQALGLDGDIRTRFPDGIQYLALGQGAFLSAAISEIAKIMRLTGASVSASAVERSSGLREAVDYAVAWFNGKTCLFLVDDLWPTDHRRTGFLGDLRQLLRSCSESRMVITTRSATIAHAAGVIVNFAPKAPLGPLSERIFMRHAARYETINALQEQTVDLRESIATILRFCAGLPIALAVCGRTVALLAKEQGNFEGACDAYAVQLGRQRTELGEVQDRIYIGIIISLTILETEFVQLKSRNGVDLESTIADLYTSFCVLMPQAQIPISVLGRLWQVDKDFALGIALLLNEMSLCTFTFDGLGQSLEERRRLMLHDLQLCFCERQADVEQTSSLWHTRILSGYMEQLPSTFKGSLSDENGDSFEHALLAHTPRPWWAVPNDGYIHVNLARHLVSSNLGIELAALLLDARWTHTRFDIGGIFSLRLDFEYLMNLDGGVFPLRVSREFDLIWRAIQLSWGRGSEGKRSFLMQVCGRLLNVRTQSAIVDSFLRSVEKHTPVPYILPVSSCFPQLRSAEAIPVGPYCLAVDCSPCGRFIAAGAGKDVLVADSLTGDILIRLKGHSKNVICVSHAVGSTKVVSGSRDRLVAVWEWKKSNKPALTLKGHTDEVIGVAVCSKGTKIFSCSRDCTVRIWDANTGTQIEEFLQDSSVWCLAASYDDQYVAIGLDDGTLKVLDSCTGHTFFEYTDGRKCKILSVAFSARDQLLATGSLDGTIRIWNPVKRTSVGEPFRGHTRGVSSVAFSPLGEHIASGSRDCTVRLWDVRTGRSTWLSKDIESWVTTVAFAPDGKKIISGSLDQGIRIWDMRFEAEANEQKYGRSGAISAVAITRDGIRVASGSLDGSVRLWDSSTGNQIGCSMQRHTGPVCCASLSHDGRQVVSSSLDSTVRLWDTESSNQAGDLLASDRGSSHCVSVSSDGDRILWASFDKTVRIWDARSGILLADALQGHAGPVGAVSESGDGSHVVSRAYDGAVIIWNRHTQTIVWKSTERPGRMRLDMTDEEAEKTIRSCGQQTPYIWPDSFPPYTAELYCRNNFVYSNVPTEDTLLGTLPSYVSSWMINDTREVFVAGLINGAVFIFKVKGL